MWSKMKVISCNYHHIWQCLQEQRRWDWHWTCGSMSSASYSVFSSETSTWKWWLIRWPNGRTLEEVLQSRRRQGSTRKHNKIVLFTPAAFLWTEKIQSILCPFVTQLPLPQERRKQDSREQSLRHIQEKNWAKPYTHMLHINGWGHLI